MEEDIKILENAIYEMQDLIEVYEEQGNVEDKEGLLEVQQAIENLIARNRKLEEQNKILKNKQTKIIADSFHGEMAKKFDEAFIPRSKIKEKIEELYKEHKKYIGYSKELRYSEIGRINFQIHVLQELLEE